MLEAQQPQIRGHVGLYPKRGHWQVGDRGGTRTGRGDEDGQGGMTRQRVRRAPGVRYRAPRGGPGPGETIDHANEHRGFAAMQMIGAGRVDDEAIGWIGRGDRGETLKHPAREPVERLWHRQGDRRPR